MTVCFPFPKSIRRYMHFSGPLEFVTEMNRDSNQCHLRILLPLWIENRKKIEEKYSPEQVNDLSKSIGFKPNEDFVDFELIHLALFGYLDESGKRHPVHCYTADRYAERLLNRVKAFKSFVKWAIKIAEHENLYLNCRETFAPGIIYKDDPETENRAAIIVQDVTPL